MLNDAKNIMINGGVFISNSKSHTSRGGKDALRDHIAPGSFHNSSERGDPPKCHPRTRLAVIQAIMGWIEDGQRTCFIKWLYGPAGSGKSAIAQTIAEICHELGLLAASFFWSRTAAGRNSEERLAASLAYQLGVFFPDVQDHIEQAVERDPSLFSRSLDAQMESLILEPLKKLFAGPGTGSPVHTGPSKLIILDGLDECSTREAQQRILKAVAQLVQKSPIPFIVLIASRPEQAIRDSFSTNPLLSMTVRLALDNTYRPDDDIKLFLVESFESIKSTHTLGSLLPLIWPTEKDIDQLVRKSSGQFIYASTVVKFVSSPRRRPHEQLNIILGVAAVGTETPFAELDALYSFILGAVEDLPKVLDLLCFVFFEFGLEMSTYEELLSYTPGDIQLILIDMHSVMYVPRVGDDGLTIGVIHASLEDYLMDPDRSGNFYIGEAKARARIVQHFLRYIHEYPVPNSSNQQAIYCGLDIRIHLTACFPTRALFADFFDFDLLKWTNAMLVNFGPDGDWGHGQFYSFMNIFDLCTWFQKQEGNVQSYFGPGISLYSHHSRSCEMALNMLFADVIRYDFENKNETTTLILHPHFQDGLFDDIDIPLAFSATSWFKCLCTFFSSDKYGFYRTEYFLEFQNYLHNPQRAGDNFVHGGMYALVPVQIIKHIKLIADRRDGMDRTNQVDGAGEEDEDEYLQSIALQLAIKALPFYLSNADFVPELEEELGWLSEYLLLAEVSETQELQQSIDLYQRRGPSSKTYSGQLCPTGYDQGSQALIDLEVQPAIENHFSEDQEPGVKETLPVSSLPSLSSLRSAVSIPILHGEGMSTSTSATLPCSSLVPYNSAVHHSSSSTLDYALDGFCYRSSGV